MNRDKRRTERKVIVANKISLDNGNLDAVEIPNCPHCKKPTIKQVCTSMSTLMYYPSIYDAAGKFESKDYNTKTDEYRCMECNKTYKIEWSREGKDRSYEYV